MTRLNAQLAERLLSEGKISSDQYEGVLHHMQRTNLPVEEALIETSVMTEPDLLKYLAAVYRTRFVTTDKLARADIDPGTLSMLPRKTAEKLNVFPVIYDATSGVLSIVAGGAADPDVAKQVQIATNAKEVRVYVSRPAAVRAAIGKHYGGDIHAFAHVDIKGIEQYRSMMNAYERNLISEESLATAIGSAERRKERVIDGASIKRGDHRAAGGRPAATGGQSVGVANEDYLETLTVLVSLLENNRGELRGHSALMARVIRKAAERIGLSPAEVQSMVCAALLHDIGKTGSYHLTALNVAEYEGHRVAAQKAMMTPLRLFESVRLTETTVTAIRTMYERYDGEGFPEKLSGKDIALGGRLLSLTETYADLTQNTRNPFRKVLTPRESFDVLARYAGKIFDPNLVDLFKHTVLGDDLRARLLADMPVVLLVDTDPEESTVLELRLLEQGYEVRAARTTEAAIQALESGEIEICISDTEFGSATGFDLIEHARKNAVAKDIPWLFLTRDARRESIAKAYELGAVDYVIKPVPNDVLVAKVRKIFDSRGARAGRGVSGSLAEMALSDIVQVLVQGRKTGVLRIRSGNESGEIHFDAGQIVNAMWGRSRGEEAFYAMCPLGTGDFVLDPTQKPAARVIQASAEALLLEGMRRLDEGSASGS